MSLKPCDDRMEQEYGKRAVWANALAEFDVKARVWNFETKLAYTEALMEGMIKQYGDRITVSCSFGKDSVVMVHLAIKFKPDIAVYFSNTGVEYPETLDYRDLLVDAWKLNYFEGKPIKSFWKCVEEYGYPKPRRLSYSKKRKRSNVDKPKCCVYLKEKPAADFYRDQGMEAAFIGLTWDESQQRRWTIIKFGDHHLVKKFVHTPLRKIWPLAYWTVEDVWKYIRDKGLPVNEIYKINKRNGCMPCTGFIGWEKQLANAKPGLYRKVQHELGQSLMEDYVDSS